MTPNKIIEHTFNERPVVSFIARGRPAWMAAQIAHALDFPGGGWPFVMEFQVNYRRGLVEGRDYFTCIDDEIERILGKSMPSDPRMALVIVGEYAMRRIVEALGDKARGPELVAMLVDQDVPVLMHHVAASTRPGFSLVQVPLPMTGAAKMVGAGPAREVEAEARPVDPPVASVALRTADASKLQAFDVEGHSFYRLDANGDPLVKDLDLATWLGFARPRDIRDLIKRHAESGLLDAAEVCGTVPQTSRKGGRPSTEYLLSYTGAVKIAARSEGPRANAILCEIVRVWDLARRGILAPIATPQAVATIPPELAMAMQTMAEGFKTMASGQASLLTGQQRIIETQVQLVGVIERAMERLAERTPPEPPAAAPTPPHAAATPPTRTVGRFGPKPAAPELRARLSANLLAIRRNFNLTHLDLGDICRVGHFNIGYYERREHYPKAPTLHRLAMSLGLEVDELVAEPLPLERVRIPRRPFGQSTGSAETH